MTGAGGHPVTHAFDDRDALAGALAAQAAEDLAAAVEARGRATLAVPGGTTPGRFLTALSRARIPWGQVSVTLTDERWVPADDARSNQRLVAETLLQGPAAAADFVPLYAPGLDPEAGAARQSEALAQVLPLDVCVLGMGADRHTASLFPGADRLADALDPNGTQPLLPIRAPGADESRVSLTAPVLRAARRLYLLIQGVEKRTALDAALAAASDTEAPVRVVLTRPGPVEVFYAD